MFNRARKSKSEMSRRGCSIRSTREELGSLFTSQLFTSASISLANLSALNYFLSAGNERETMTVDTCSRASALYYASPSFIVRLKQNPRGGRGSPSCKQPTSPFPFISSMEKKKKKKKRERNKRFVNRLDSSLPLYRDIWFTNFQVLSRYCHEF